MNKIDEMNKIFLFILFFCCVSPLSAQELSDMELIQNRIIGRESIMEKVNKRALADSLKKQVDDYRHLADILKAEVKKYSSENQKMKSDLYKYQILTSVDTLVFHQDFKMIGDIPSYFRERVDIIISIIGLRKKIVATESIAQELEQMLGNGPEAYAAIRVRIQNDLDDIQVHIRKIKGMNLSSLSEVQQNYFRPGLTERYNNFKKYF